MSESAAWRETARDLMSSFGDVVVDAQITSQGGTKTYDRATGKTVGTPASVTVPLIPFEQKSKLKSPDLWREGDVMVMIGTFGLASRPKSGSQVSWTCARTAQQFSLRIVQVSEEDMGTMAFCYLHLRGVG